MNPRDQEQIIEALAVFGESEQAVSEFYSICGGLCPGDRQTWLAIAEEEQEHARMVARMQELFAAYPDDFKKGRPFNVVAIRTFIKGVRWNQCRAISGELKGRKLAGVSKDIENSIIESSFTTIVETENRAYQALVQKLMDDSVRHRATFSGMLAG